MKISKPCLDAKMEWFEEKMKGDYIESEDNAKRDKNWQKKLYSKKEKKDISEDARNCYFVNDEEYDRVCTKLAKFGREPQPVTIDGNCMFTAPMTQLRLNPTFTQLDLRRQIAYFMAKLPEQFFGYADAYLEGQSFQSYIMNIWNGKSYGDALCLGVLAHMWNLKITVISPNSPDALIFHHDEEDPDIILVHNGREDLEGHYSSTSEYIFISNFLNRNPSKTT